MSLVEGFREIVVSGRLDFSVRALSPLTVGSGREELNPLAPDIPLLRDSSGRPVIPGSTLKGFFRSGIERILSGLGIHRYGALVSDLMGSVRGEAWGSRLLFRDAPVRGELGRDYRMGVRDHVALDPSTMAVRHGPFRQEYVEPGAVFDGSLSFRNVPPAFLSLLQPVATMAREGVFRIGRSKSRGYGHVEIEFKALSVVTVMPPGQEDVRFRIRFPRMDRVILLEVSRTGQTMGFRDDLSECELTGKIREGGLPLTTVDMNWGDVSACVESLIRGLREWAQTTRG